MPKEKYNPADKYAWGEGSIEIIKRGSGGPLISEEELDCILRENPEPVLPDRPGSDDVPDRFALEHLDQVDLVRADGTTVNWAEHVKAGAARQSQ